MALLEVKNLGISFGGLRAVDQFEINIKKGQLYGLIGPNGAGKTTIFNMLTGVYKPTDGIIKLDGEDLVGKKTIEINKAGIARTFQNIRLFSQQSVLDNVKIGLHNQYKYSISSIVSFGFIPAAGSSNRRSFGFVASALAISNLRCSPYGRFDARKSALSSSSNTFKSSIAFSFVIILI